MKKALITGVTGQDGSYLAELLLSKDYEVIGLYRRTSSPNFSRIAHIKDRLTLVEGDVTDFSSLSYIVNKHKPNEIYNLAAQSHVHTSFSQPFYTTQVDYIGCLNLLEIVKNVTDEWWSGYIKLYQASTSEMFGDSFNYLCDERILYGHGQRTMDIFKALEVGDKEYGFCQNESTPFRPNSPYAIAKLAAHNAVRLYRESYGTFTCSGILFNHESERRGDEFVTQKIAKYIHALASHCVSLKTRTFKKDSIEDWFGRMGRGKLKLGNLDASRDWGHARDYVKGMWLMLQQDKPMDFVLATGETHTVREFLQEAFSCWDLNWEEFVEIDENLKRPCEVPYLKGDATAAKEILGWIPEISFKDLVRMMVYSGLARYSEGNLYEKSGISTSSK